MNIKSLLLGSAAALAVVSGAQAADAIVAAEPEPVEYVRVCDAYGTGYFYIPGTETCLKIQGYIRFQVDWSAGDVADQVYGGEDWSARTRGQVAFTAKSDTEYGPLTGVIVYQANFRPNGPANSQDAQNDTVLDEAYIDIAGFRVGKFVNWWDNDFSGETESINNNTNFNAIRYQYDSGDFWAGIAVEELTNTGFEDRDGDGVATDYTDGGNNVGIDVGVGGKFGAISAELLGGYDIDREEGAIRGIIYADIGPGTFGLAGVWASGPSDYYANGEWAIAAQYAVKATEKFTITPAVQYTDNIDVNADGDFDGGSEWRAGVTLDYEIVENLTTKVTVNYVSEDHDGAEDVDGVTGFFRLQRSF